MTNHATLVHLLRDRASSHPDQLIYTFLQDGKTPSGSLTYQQLDQQARAIAAVVQSQISPGDRVLLLYPSGLEFISAFFGCLYAGVIAIPAPPPTSFGKARVQRRLDAIANDASPSLILTTTQLHPSITALCAEIPALQSCKSLTAEMIALDWVDRWVEPPIDSDHLAYLQYTSGSTATPKGVMISHDNLMANLAILKLMYQCDTSSISATWMPHFHDAGLVHGLLRSLYVGTPNYVLSPLTLIKHPIRWLETISRYRVSHTPGTNFLYDYCVTQTTPSQRQGLDLSCWKVAVVGAEPVRDKTLQSFTETFAPHGFSDRAFCPGYGLAEATLAVSLTSMTALPVFYTLQPEALTQNQVVEAPVGQSFASCGVPAENTDIVIVHPETQTRCAADEIGEIWVAGRSVAQGYWNRPEATEQTFRACLAGTKQTYLRTGDLGFLKNGHLVVTGRIKDLIIIRGQNYYPQDIEWTVQASHPVLRPNCGAVFGIEHNGVEQVVIVQEVERHASRSLDRHSVIAAIRQAVAEQHELPVYAVVLLKAGSITKTSSGKIQRHACHAAFLNQELDSLAVWQAEETPADRHVAPPRNEFEFRLCKLWQKVLKVPIGIHDHLFEMGGDSLTAAAILSGIEAGFGQSLEWGTLIENPTVAQLADRLAQPEWAQSARSLVAIKPEGNKRPFFYVHPRSGSVVMYANLGRCFAVDRPLYGLQSVGLDGKQEPLSSVEDMAAHYIREIRTVQPEGPYLVGGRCFGGIVALEVAQQLVQQGSQVACLVLVESPLTAIADLGLRHNIEQNMARMTELSPQRANTLQKVLNANDQAGRDYSIQLYSGQVSYIAAEETIHDPSDGFGWAKIAVGQLNIHTVPGNHSSISEAQNIQTFVQCLNSILDQAEAEVLIKQPALRLQQIRMNLERSRSWLQEVYSSLN